MSSQKRVAIIGAYGFSNTGDDAILQSWLQELKAYDPKMDIIVLGGQAKAICQQYPLNAIEWSDWPQVLDVVPFVDLFIVGGGLFHDYWGMDSERFLMPPLSASPIYYISLIALAKILGRPCIIAGAGVGPLATATGREFTRYAFEVVDYATVRDQGSLECLRNTGCTRPEVAVTSDPAFRLETPNPLSGWEKVIHSVPARPVIGVCLRNWNIAIDSNHWEKIIARDLDAVLSRTGGTVIFMPFQTGGGDSLTEDPLVAKRIREQMLLNGRTLWMYDYLTPNTVDAMLGACDLVVGMRLHSLILSLRHGKPVVALAYDPKVSGLMSDAQLSEQCLDLYSLREGDLIRRIESAFHTSNSLTSRALTYAKNARTRSRQDTLEAIRLLEIGLTHQPSFDAPLQTWAMRVLKEHAMHQGESSRPLDLLPPSLHQTIAQLEGANARLLNQERELEELKSQLSQTEQELEKIKRYRWYPWAMRYGKVKGIVRRMIGNAPYRERHYNGPRPPSTPVPKPQGTPCEGSKARPQGPSLTQAERPEDQSKVWNSAREATPLFDEKNPRSGHFRGADMVRGSEAQEDMKPNLAGGLLTANLGVPEYVSSLSEIDPKKRIAIVTPAFFEMNGTNPYLGGAERYLIELVHWLRQLGYEPEVYQPADSQWRREFGEVKIVGLNTGGIRERMNEVFHNLVPRPGLTIYLAFFLAAPQCFQPSIGISHGVFWDIGAPFDSEQQHEAKIKNALECFRNLTCVVSVDTNTINWVRTSHWSLAEKFHYIPNFVDTSRFHPLPRQSSEKSKELVILYPRRLCQTRGISFMMEVTPNILNRFPHVNFSFVGQAETDVEQKFVEGLMRSHPERVRWEVLPPDRMPEAYSAADISLIPTLYAEGTSLSCLEAMASGNAVIATNVGGLPNIVLDHFNGLLIKPCAQDLEQAIEELIRNPELQLSLGRRAIETAKTFHLERWHSNWQRVIEICLPKRA